LVRELVVDDGSDKVGILVGIEPARLGYDDTEESVERLKVALADGVASGLRATLETGNILTGSMFVSVDFFSDAAPAAIGRHGDHMTIPTLASGLEGLGRQVTSVLAKIDKLPLDKTVAELNRTLSELRKVIASEAVEDLPANLNASLAELSRTLESLSPGSPIYQQLDRVTTELTRTLQSVEDVSRTVAEQPSAIIFDRPIELDPEPRGLR
jgi:paraquat-inducible protein B